MFHTLAVSGLPVFCLANKTEAYRFVTLIDVMYEHRCARAVLFSEICLSKRDFQTLVGWWGGCLALGLVFHIR